MKNTNAPKRVRVKALPKENMMNKIDIATQTLERNIGFINSCDSKTSIVLTAIGVLLTIILTNDGLATIFCIISNSISGKSFCDILYLIGLLASAVILVIGIWNLMRVLIANTEPSTKSSNSTIPHSMIFFGGILKVGNHTVYHSKFLEMTDQEILNDLVAEIYINAEIASQKYRRYNRGLKLAALGFVLFILMLLVGMYIYK